MKFSCVDCKVKACDEGAYSEERVYPAFCPTASMTSEQRELLRARYSEEPNNRIMVAAAAVEHEGYGVWPRVEEIIRFAEKIGAKKIGIATCIGLLNEASVFAEICRARGLEPYGICCKAGAVEKVAVGISKDCCDVGEVMCNPIAQAELLNSAGCELNVVIGLCVGHDSLFYKYSEAPTTTLVTKDRVTGHNPVAPLYNAKSYYDKKLFEGKWPGDGK